MFEILLNVGSGGGLGFEFPPGCDISLKHGDSTLGYLGRIHEDCFIKGSELADICGVDFGQPTYIDSGYLGYMVNDKMVFLARQPFKTHTNLRQLDLLGLRYGKEFNIKGKQFIVRTIKQIETQILLRPLLSGQSYNGNNWDDITLSELLGPGITYIMCQEQVQGMYQRVVKGADLTSIDHTTYNASSPPAYQAWRPMIIEV